MVHSLDDFTHDSGLALAQMFHSERVVPIVSESLLATLLLKLTQPNKSAEYRALPHEVAHAYCVALETAALEHGLYVPGAYDPRVARAVSRTIGKPGVDLEDASVIAVALVVQGVHPLALVTSDEGIHTCASAIKRHFGVDVLKRDFIAQFARLGKR